jgi:hypothetical protein
MVMGTGLKGLTGMATAPPAAVKAAIMEIQARRWTAERLARGPAASDLALNSSSSGKGSANSLSLLAGLI